MNSLNDFIRPIRFLLRTCINPSKRYLNFDNVHLWLTHFIFHQNRIANFFELHMHVCIKHHSHYWHSRQQHQLLKYDQHSAPWSCPWWKRLHENTGRLLLMFRMILHTKSSSTFLQKTLFNMLNIHVVWNPIFSILIHLFVHNMKNQHKSSFDEMWKLTF